eukprot:CAMPEP_0196591724 /NCGR_PEP_ID=MMETSP1081-20130531/70698_1 /TAXON_ID=36882 /ORGANISM="Pyramimonas amylifera, Strain CCMP720" /LENGTH=51 /DNA_ID=CAMNT_0041915183 /DNA_START=35 /DNA_END=187 /DNA_ORIENTATION=+
MIVGIPNPISLDSGKIRSSWARLKIFAVVDELDGDAEEDAVGKKGVDADSE